MCCCSMMLPHKLLKVSKILQLNGSSSVRLHCLHLNLKKNKSRKFPHPGGFPFAAIVRCVFRKKVEWTP